MEEIANAKGSCTCVLVLLPVFAIAGDVISRFMGTHPIAIAVRFVITGAGVLVPIFTGGSSWTTRYRSSTS